MYSQATSLVQSPPWISCISKFRAKFFSRGCKNQTLANLHTPVLHVPGLFSSAPLRSLVLI